MTEFRESANGRPAVKVWLAPIALFVLFQLSVTAGPLRFTGSQHLQWKASPGCPVGGAPAALLGKDQALTSFSAKPGLPPAQCSSEPFTAAAPILQLEYVDARDAAAASGPVVEVLKSSGETAAQAAVIPAPPFPGVEPSWSRALIILPSAVRGEKISVRVSSPGRPSAAWYALRARAAFFSSPVPHGELVFKLHKKWVRALLSILLGISLVAAGRFLLRTRLSPGRLALILFITGFAVHFRFDVYFFWDEWSTFERFQTTGLASIFHTHNEHFLPIFFFLYFLETRLFHHLYPLYTAVSAGILALNGTLLYLLLLRLAGRHPFKETAAQLIAVLFVFSALHSEVMQWAFGQPVLLAQTAALFCFLSGLEALESGAFRKLGLCALAAAAAPFLFGNGFIIPVQLAILIGLSLPVMIRPDINLTFFEAWEQRVRRGFVLLLFTAVLSAVPIAAYYFVREGSGHGLAQAQPFAASPAALFSYIFIGTQLGAVMRGIGFFAIEDYTVPYYNWMPAQLEPALFFAYLGFGLSLVLLFVSLCSAEFVKNLCLWLLGQMLLITTFFLPALGRWQLGLEQSLSLRYDTAALPGLGIILLPAVLVLLEGADPLLTYFRLPGRALGKLLYGAAAVHLAAQLYFSSGFTYFTSRGVQNRLFIAELADWKARLDLLPARSTPVPYDGSTTPLAGLAPSYPDSLAPGLTPERIASVYKWLTAFRIVIIRT